MERFVFGTTRDGQEVDGFVLRNKNGMEVQCIAYGCRLTHILLPAQGGGKVNVILGYDTFAEYEDDSTFQGAVVGRYANRIAGASLTVAGKPYSLTKNDGENYLHGSWHRRVFAAEAAGENSVLFRTVSPDGEDGFPGAVRVRVRYTLTDENELRLDYEAVSTAPTVLNMTNHAYFNLAAEGDILSHSLQLNAGRFLEAGPGLIPTGRLLEAAGAFDFAQEKPVGQDIAANDPQLKAAGGYDHCYVINAAQPGLAFAAALRHPESGRELRVYTTQPGIQLYTGNSLQGFAPRAALCLETQHFPDSPHQPKFPSTQLVTGEKYRHSTVFRFGW